jgi:hypothetical protein
VYDAVNITLTGTAETSQEGSSPSINGGVVSVARVIVDGTTVAFPSTATLSLFGASYGLYAIKNLQVSTGETTQYIHPRVEQNSLAAYVNEQLKATIVHGTTTMDSAQTTLRIVIDGQVTKNE